MKDRFRLDSVKWEFRTVTAATTSPLTLVEIRNRLRLDSGTDDDADLSMMMSAAVHWWQDTTGQYLLPQTQEMHLDRFPQIDEVLYIPCSPNQALKSIEYEDEDGNTVTWASDKYRYAATVNGGRLRPVNNWPTVRKDRFGQVRIQVSAGYTTVPDDIKDAMLLWIGARYRFREEIVVTGGQEVIQVVPLGASAIAERYRVHWERNVVV